jgi:hypothetical protein
VSENSVGKTLFRVFGRQREAETGPLRRGRRLRLKTRARTLPLPTACCWCESKAGFKMEIPANTAGDALS